MERQVTPGARFVDPKILARIGNLELLARTVVEGFINGLHRAPFFGASIDFAEHRGYVAGDDIRRVDWRLYARTDRYYVKQYEADTNTNVSILFDISKSMQFARRGILILISDFYEEPDTILEAIKPLRFIGNELIVFHVLDPAELDFGYDDASSFEDLETGEQIPVVPESLRDEYRAMIRAHIEALTTKFSEHRIDYTLLNTAEPLDRALFSYLSSRERLMRVR